MKNNFISIISNVIGLVAGLNMIFRFIIPLIIKNIRRKSSSSTNEEDLTGNWKNDFDFFNHSVKSFMILLNLLLINSLKIITYPVLFFINRCLNIKCDCLQSSQCKEESPYLRKYYFVCSILESLLQSTLESKFNETIEYIIERLMIDQWQSTIQYENYYQKYNSKLCIYRTNENYTLIYLISMLMIIYSGLSHILKILFPIIIKFIRYLS